MTDFPEAGDKLTFCGVPNFYYPMFLDMKVRAERLLSLGATYTASKVEVLSSWCSVELKGIEGYYNLNFFTKHEPKPESETE